MKKQLFKLITIVAWLFLSQGIVSAQHTAPYRSVTAHYLSWVNTGWEKMYIDGQDLEDSYGAQEDVTWCWNPATNVIAARDLGGFIKMCHDDSALYLFCHITDDSAGVFIGNGNPMDFDHVEVFLDMDTTINLVSGLGGYDQAALGATTTDANMYCWGRGVPDSSLNNPARNGASLNNFALSDPGTYWNLEVAIPWLATMPEGKTFADVADWVNTSTTIGFDISFADNDSDTLGYLTGRLAWEPDTDAFGSHAESGNAWHDTRVFGLLDFNDMGPDPCYEDPCLCGCTPPIPHNNTDDVSFSNIEVYPTFAPDMLNINNLPVSSSITIVNILNQLVKTVPLTEAPSVQINMSDLPSGIYLVNIKLDGAKILTKVIYH